MQKSNDQKNNLKTAQEIVNGDYVMISNQPCIVTQTQHSKPGKHVMKALIQGRNLFTQRKMESIQKFTESIEIIKPQYSQQQILIIDEDFFVSILQSDLSIKQIKMVNLDQQRQNIMKYFNQCQKQDKKLFAKILKVKDRQEVIGYKIQ